MLRALLVLLAAALIAGAAAPRAEATGGLDKSYGDRGRALIPGANVFFSAGADATPDGGLVLAGGSIEPRPELVLARHDGLGRPVDSFGRRGVAIRKGRVPGAVAALPDGRILVAGNAPGDRRDRLLLARFDDRGRLDAGFGEGGEVLLDFGGGRRPNALALLALPDGRSLVAGTDVEESIDLDYGRLILARFLTDGRPDPTFGRNGVVELRPARGRGAGVFSVAATPDGGLLAAGVGQSLDDDDDADNQLLLARVDASGRRDPRFGKAGFATLAGLSASANAVAALPDGGVLVAGSVDVDSRGELGGSDALVARFDRRGRLDRSFGRAGRVRVRAGDGDFSDAAAMRVGADGRIVLAGSAADCGTDDALVARLDSDGRLDTTFGRGGRLLVPSATGDLGPTALLPLGDGRMLVAGRTGTSPPGLEALRIDTALPAPVSDGQPPKARVAPLRPSLRRRRVTRIRVRITLDEAATVKLRLGAVPVGPLRLGIAVAERVLLELPAGTQTVEVPVQRLVRSKELRGARLIARACADDAAGNRTRVRGEVPLTARRRSAPRR